jgi:N-acetylneuraminic acid mutarotase
MRKLLLSILLILVSLLSFAQTNYWYPVDSLNGQPKSVSTSFVLSNEGYVVGGLTDSEFTRKMHSYNPNQNDWDTEASIGGETGSGQSRGSAVSFTVNNKAYIGLGQGNTALYFKDFWAYDPSTAVWTQVADFAGSARHGAIAFGNNMYGYVGTGQAETGLKKDFFRYNPVLNTWSQLNDFPGSARKYAVGFMMGSQGYLATGDDGVLKNDLWQYHPDFDLWVQKASMPVIGRAGAVGWGTFPTLYIATGEDATGTIKNDLWEYNFYGNAWFQRADVPGSPRKHATAFVINDIAYVGTGYYNGVFYDDFYAYVRQLGTEEKEKQRVQLYPNPCSEKIHFLSDLPVQFIRIKDEQGKIVQEEIVAGNTSTLLDLPSGQYVVELTLSNNEIITEKIIKQ